jgi:uncharacterized membrane protein
MPLYTSRIWEIDFTRGIAIVLMVLFHLVVDLRDFFGYDLNYFSGFWYYEGKISAGTFMLVAGISATLHHRNLRRGCTVLAWGMVISAVTYVYNPETYVRFGILHLLGASMITFHYVQQLSSRLLLLGSFLVIAAGQWTTSITAPNSLLLPFGMTPEGFASLDYYPLFPWSGLFFSGAALGKTVYKEDRHSRLPWHSIAAPLTALGRHSLVIYLVHQPVLLALLWIYHRL